MQYQVWYMRPEFFGNGITGAQPNVANLSATHVHLKDVEANGLDAVYHEMQGEVWSPNGEARGLIDSKGLQHTSMCVGDVIVDDVGNAHLVASIGFKAIGGVPKAAKSWKSEVIADNSGKWVGNALRFATKEEAERYVGDLSMRWTAVRETRVIESDEPINYAIIDSKLTAVA